MFVTIAAAFLLPLSWAQSTPSPALDAAAYRAGLMVTMQALAASEMAENGAHFELDHAQMRRLVATLTNRGGRAREGRRRLSREQTQRRVQRLSDVHAHGPFELTITLENDNLLFTLWPKITSRGEDGSDLGRTHGVTIVATYGLSRYLRVGLDLQTTLFTRRTDGSYRRPESWETVDVHFNELNDMRLRLELGDRDIDGAGLVLTGGVVLQNRETDTIGASGQQQFFHELVRSQFNSSIWTFNHVPDGGGITAGAVIGAFPFLRHHIVEDRWARIRVRGTAGVDLNSILAGSRIHAGVSAVVEIGRRRDIRGSFGVSQEFDLWLSTGEIGSVSRAMIRLETVPLEMWLALNVYEFSPNLEYYIYNFNNVTMTGGATLRIE